MFFKSFENGVFHVHTSRCRHASDENDESYVRKALELGAEAIAFTDHAPFPGKGQINNKYNTTILYGISDFHVHQDEC